MKCFFARDRSRIRADAVYIPLGKTDIGILRETCCPFGLIFQPSRPELINATQTFNEQKMNKRKARAREFGHHYQRAIAVNFSKNRKWRKMIL